MTASRRHSGGDGIIPFRVEWIAPDVEGVHLGVARRDALRMTHADRVNGAPADQSYFVVVAGISSTTTSRPVSGLPRQVWVMWQNRRCSMLVPLCALPRRTDVVGANPTRVTLAPAGSARSGSGGDEWSGSTSGKGPFWGSAEPCGPQHKPTLTRPRKDQCESRPASGTGRSPSSGKRARYAPDGLTGVKVAARMAEHQCAVKGSLSRRPGSATRWSTANP